MTIHFRWEETPDHHAASLMLTPPCCLAHARPTIIKHSPNIIILLLRVRNDDSPTTHLSIQQRTASSQYTVSTYAQKCWEHLWHVQLTEQSCAVLLNIALEKRRMFKAIATYFTHLIYRIAEKLASIKFGDFSQNAVFIKKIKFAD